MGTIAGTPSAGFGVPGVMFGTTGFGSGPGPGVGVGSPEGVSGSPEGVSGSPVGSSGVGSSTAVTLRVPIFSVTV